MSRPVTSAPASAAGIATFPAPHATSSTRWPEVIGTLATSVGPNVLISRSATSA